MKIRLTATCHPGVYYVFSKNAVFPVGRVGTIAALSAAELVTDLDEFSGDSWLFIPAKYRKPIHFGYTLWESLELVGRGYYE